MFFYEGANRWRKCSQKKKYLVNGMSIKMQNIYEKMGKYYKYIVLSCKDKNYIEYAISQEYPNKNYFTIRLNGVEVKIGKLWEIIVFMIDQAKKYNTEPSSLWFYINSQKDINKHGQELKAKGVQNV